VVAVKDASRKAASDHADVGCIGPAQALPSIVQASPKLLRPLAAAERAQAVLWQGRPVAIELPTGDTVQTNAWGHRVWLRTLFLGMFATAGPPMLVEAARLKRRTTNGWWSIRREDVAPALAWRPLTMGLSPLMAAACLLAVPSMLGVIPSGIRSTPALGSRRRRARSRSGGLRHCQRRGSSR
jgi:hypothetical protein